MCDQEPPSEVWDAAYNIAKAWGCVCVPTITKYTQDPERNVLNVTLRHKPWCGYNPGKFFEQQDGVDMGAIKKQARLQKLARQRTSRKYTQPAPGSPNL